VLEKEIFDLERALESNREIGVAMSILMAREMCTQSQAFNRLRTASQQLNRKLRDIADDVKRTGQLPVRAPSASEGGRASTLAADLKIRR
jgi:AmiR/NasT family two-component response regulator